MMKKLTRYSIGAALVAAALTLPQSADAQNRSNPLAYGAGSSLAQRADQRSAIQSGVYIAPGVGVREVPKPVEAYESSEWTQKTAENFAEATSVEQLQRAYDANQERAKNRHTTRPLNVPTTLGMLKDKPNAQKTNAVNQNVAIRPQYLQYGPNLAPVQNAQAARRPATGGAATLNWDGSTNRAPMNATQNPPVQLYGAVQAPTHSVAKPAILDAAVSPQDQTPLAPIDDEFGAAPKVPSVAPFPEIATEPEPSNFAQDVVNELQNAAIPEDDVPTLDAPAIDVPEVQPPADLGAPATLEQNAPTFVAPNVGAPSNATLDQGPGAPEMNDVPEVPDFNAPGELAPAADETVVQEPAPTAAPSQVAPETPLDPVPQTTPATPQPAAPAKTQASANPAAPANVPNARQSYPAPKNVTPYAPKQDYLLMQPYHAPQAQAYPAPRPQRMVPQSRGIPSQFAYSSQTACAPQGACQVDQGASYGAYGGYDSGLGLACAATEGVQPGLIVGAEWFDWTTDSGVASATVYNRGGASDRRRLEIKKSGLRGRVGFRTLAGWDLIGTYTWFNQSAAHNLAASRLAPGATLVSPRAGIVASLDSVASTLKVDLQAIDLELGRWTKIGLWDFRAFGGVRWTGLTQDVVDTVSYAQTSVDPLDAEIALLDSSALFDEDGATALAATAVAEPGTVTKGVATRSRLNAFGVRLGLETRVPLAYGLAIYGRGAGALAAGRVKSTAFGVQTPDSTVFKKTYLTPSVDASLGLSWRLNGLETRVGYEFNGWYNSGYVAGKKTDFLAHGVVAGLGYNY